MPSDHHESSTVNRAEAAEHLREIADQIEAGAIDLGRTSVEVPDQLEYEFDLGREEDVDGVEHAIALKLHWVDPDGDIEDAETPHGTSLVGDLDDEDDGAPGELGF